MANLGSTADGDDVTEASPTTTTDRISFLPDEILHHILSFLPMRFAVGTSILSNRWRYLWTFNPNIDFPLDPTFISEEEDYINIINQCLRLHNRPTINRLHITILAGQQDFSMDVKTWVTFATNKAVRELNLSIFAGKSHNTHLPELLFFHTPLMELTVSSTMFNLPLGFKGFPSLQVLQLCNVCISDETVQSLLLGCPVLEKLTIWGCNDLMNLNISAPNLVFKILEVGGCEGLKKLTVDAPNLISFRYEGESVIRICLLDVSSLVEADVSFWGSLKHEDAYEWTPLVKSMANVESLTVRPWFSQLIFAANIVTRIPHIPFMNLKDFYLCGDLFSRYEILAIATFLEDCPMLQKLFINLEYQSPASLAYGFDWYQHYCGLIKGWIPPFEGAIRNRSRKEEKKRSRKEDKKRYLQHLHYVLPHLKKIEIVGFSGTKKELELVKFLFDKATALDSFLVTSLCEDGTEEQIPNCQLQEQLSQLPKASKHAKIVVLEPPPELF